MKRLGKGVLRVIALALIFSLAAALYPYARDWVGALLLQGKYSRAVTVISREIEKLGELTAVRHTEQGVMENTTNALLIGQVQKVTVPYTYEIGLGIDLSAVGIEAGERSLQVSVPPARMLYDSFRPSGAPQVSDLLYPLSETKYQDMLAQQAEACRQNYLNDPKNMDDAWQAACEALEKLIGQWTGEELTVSFAPGSAE